MASRPGNLGLDLVVLVSGRGSNLQALLDAQTNGSIRSRVKAVISNKADALALQRAADAGIATRVIPSKGKTPEAFSRELLDALGEFSPDLIVLAGFMKILAPAVIRAYAGRIINIHPSLLPAFPGLNAQEQALNAKVPVTGCTVHIVDEGCDTGPILFQDRETILEDDTVESLSTRLLAKEHACLVRAVASIESGEVVLQGKETLLRE